MKDKIKSILGIIFFVAFIIFFVSAFAHSDDKELDDIQRVRQQIREEKLIQGGWK